MVWSLAGFKWLDKSNGSLYVRTCMRACMRSCVCVACGWAHSDCHVFTRSRWRKRQSVKRYRQTGTRLEHLEGIDDPLVVRAQQRTDVLAWRIAQPLGHTSPAPLLAHHLKPTFTRHHLQGTVIVNVIYKVVAKQQLVGVCVSQWEHTNHARPI